jgi:hypothetical protein
VYVKVVVWFGGSVFEMTWLNAGSEEAMQGSGKGCARDLPKERKLASSLRQQRIPAQRWPPDWVVDILAVGSGEAASRYLAPYGFRVALSNLLALQDGHATFRYPHATTKTTRTATLPAETFIGRFLQPVLPRGFQKVRTDGLLHPKQRPRFAIVKEHTPSDTRQPVNASPPSQPEWGTCIKL